MFTDELVDVGGPTVDRSDDGGRSDRHGIEAPEPLTDEPLGPLSTAPAHTFANGELDPDTANALVLNHRRKYVIGSPPLMSPIYDPGGPATVIDRIVGTDRQGLLREAASAKS